jgi:HPt (histidine-containing phosphotransfer) domain-containing protein
MSGLASARLQKLERLCFRLAQQFRQLGKNGRDALRLVAREQFAAESATRLLFEIYIGEGLPVQVFHHKTAVQLLDGPVGGKWPSGIAHSSPVSADIVRMRSAGARGSAGKGGCQTLCPRINAAPHWDQSGVC